MFGRDKIALIVGEFLASSSLALVMLSMVGRRTLPYFTAVAGGLAVAAFAYMFRSHTNPAVTLGLWTIRKVQTIEALIRVAVQMAGGLAAWQLSEYLLNSPLNNIADVPFDWRIFLAEALGAIVLGLGVAAAYSGLMADAGRRAFQFGAAYALAIMIASLASNGIINPSVALGLQSWGWPYTLAPLVGAVVGTSLYGILFAERLVATATATNVKASAGSRRTAAKTPARRGRKPATQTPTRSRR